MASSRSSRSAGTATATGATPATTHNRAQFISNLVGYATANGFDGIDLDIEDGVWLSQNPPVDQMTTCIEAISAASHAAGLLLSET
jgi:chitinase